MSDERVLKDVGIATAYGYAVAGGYTGTEEEFAELMASYAEVAEEAAESAEKAETEALKSEGNAVGKQDGTDVEEGSPYYHNNAKYYAEQAAGSATAASDSAGQASGSANTAAAQALKAEGHAIGKQNGTDVGEGSPYYHNNSKYFADQAAGKATEASESAGAAAGSATQAAASAATSAAMTGLAPQFDSTKAYSAGDYVLYSGTLYQFTSAHAAGAWTGTDAVQAVMSDGVSDLKSHLSEVGDVLNMAFNVFNAVTLEISSTSNWEILSKTPTSISVRNKTGYSTGYPKATLFLAAGDYIFSANFTQSAVDYFQLYKDGSFGKQLLNNTKFTIESGSTYEIRFVASTIATYTITEISIKEDVGTNEIDRLNTEVASLGNRVDIIENDLIPIYENVEAVSTTSNQIITNEGTTASAGSEYYIVKKYPVEEGKEYLVTGSTAWGNLIYAFYSSSNTLLLKGTRADTSGTDTTITDEKTEAPSGASYVLIAFHTTTLTTSVCKEIAGYVTYGGYPVRWAGKKWVCVGDSLTEVNAKTTKHYFDYVSEATGITVVNMGLSGTGYARRKEQNEAFYQRISACPTDADVVTIFGSFNDIGAGLPIGSVDDTGTDSLAGCINTTITNLQTIIPLVNLGIIAPTPWDTTQPPATAPSAGQLNAYNYVEMLKAICARRSIPFLDLWRESNLRPWDADFRAVAYSHDGGSGTHPDENGHKLIAPRFKGFLESLLF